MSESTIIILGEVAPAFSAEGGVFDPAEPDLLIDMGRSALTWPLPAVLLVVLLLAVLVVLWFRRTRRRAGGAAPSGAAEGGTVAGLSPHLEALAALEALERALLASEAGEEPFFRALSRALRNYVARRFEIPALELASHEILVRLVDRGVSATDIGLMRDLLSSSDRIKFSGRRGERGTAASALDAGRAFVRKTAPGNPAGPAVGSGSRTPAASPGSTGGAAGQGGGE